MNKNKKTYITINISFIGFFVFLFCLAIATAFGFKLLLYDLFSAVTILIASLVIIILSYHTAIASLSLRKITIIFDKKIIKGTRDLSVFFRHQNSFQIDLNQVDRIEVCCSFIDSFQKSVIPKPSFSIGKPLPLIIGYFYLTDDSVKKIIFSYMPKKRIEKLLNDITQINQNIIVKIDYDEIRNW